MEPLSSDVHVIGVTSFPGFHAVPISVSAVDFLHPLGQLTCGRKHQDDPLLGLKQDNICPCRGQNARGILQFCHEMSFFFLINLTCWTFRDLHECLW